MDISNLDLSQIDAILLGVFGVSVTGALYYVFSELAKLSPLAAKYLLEEKDIDGAIKSGGYNLADKVSDAFEQGVRLGAERAEKFLTEKAENHK